MSPPFWQSLATLCLSAVTAFIAFAVYRVQSEKLFVDTFRLRLDALNECIDAAHARINEIREYRVTDNRSADSATLRRFWDAERAAKPLFGPDVHAAIKAVERGLVDFDVAFVAMIETRYDEAERGRSGKYDRQLTAQFEIYRLIAGLSAAAQPYVSLGSRGLSLTQRVAIRLRSIWNNIRRKTVKPSRNIN